MMVKSIRQYLALLQPSQEIVVSSTRQRWLTILTWTCLIALYGLALVMRLYTLDVPLDRDSFDEGVYWQSLRAMSSGHLLYKDIFYSQPPFFLLSLYPFYTLFGHSLWAARLGIAILSLLGLVGAAMMGRALAGRPGMVMAVLLLLIDPIFLNESQIIQAEIPSVALILLAMGCAYLWYKHPQGTAGILLASGTGICLALGLLSKLLMVPAIVPIAILFLFKCWNQRKESRSQQRALALTLLAGMLAMIITVVAVLLPFLGSWSALWQMVITFHTDAEHISNVFMSSGQPNLLLVMMTPFTLLAAYGTLIALLKRDERVISLLCWLIATLIILARQKPLFTHHLIALSLPLMALSVLAFQPLPVRPRILQHTLIQWLHPLLIIAILLPLVTVNLIKIQGQYTTIVKNAQARDIQIYQQIVRDLHTVTPEHSEIITDAPFLAGLADLSTPPMLVDVSQVRIISGYVTASDIITTAARPNIHVVLINGDTRLRIIPGFMNWLQQYYRLHTTYVLKNDTIELWVKIGGRTHS